MKRTFQTNDFSELKRGSMELVILSLLRHHPNYGYALYAALRDGGHPDFVFRPQTLYPLLHRLERREWIAGASEEGRQHRQQRIYSLTPEGERIFQQHLQQWKRFTKAVETLLEYTPPKPYRGRSLKAARKAPSKPSDRKQKYAKEHVADALLKSLVAPQPIRNLPL